MSDILCIKDHNISKRSVLSRMKSTTFTISVKDFYGLEDDEIFKLTFPDLFFITKYLKNQHGYSHTIHHIFIDSGNNLYKDFKFPNIHHSGRPCYYPYGRSSKDLKTSLIEEISYWLSTPFSNDLMPYDIYDDIEESEVEEIEDRSYVMLIEYLKHFEDRIKKDFSSSKTQTINEFFDEYNGRFHV